tara:strand:+ start:69 stop:602 length:534 start_codon:yes stop_codon:yes gene_type:complete
VINFLFSSSFYIKFKAPNSTQIIDSINQHISDVSTFEMEWGKRCNVNTVTLNWKDFINLYTPSLDIVSDKLNSKFNFLMYDPWINLYNTGQFQEIHDHSDNDMSCVFFKSSGDEFFFYDRNSVNLSRSMKKLLNYGDSYSVKAESGDIMFFPSHMLHGVCPSKIPERITMSVNFDIT